MSPYIYRRVTDYEDPHARTGPYTVEGEYDVYDRQTGEFLTTVVKRPERVYAKWEAHAGVRVFRDSCGVPVPRSLTADAETRDQAVTQAMRLRAQSHDSEDREVRELHPASL